MEARIWIDVRKWAINQRMLVVLRSKKMDSLLFINPMKLILHFWSLEVGRLIFIIFRCQDLAILQQQ